MNTPLNEKRKLSSWKNSGKVLAPIDPKKGFTGPRRKLGPNGVIFPSLTPKGMSSRQSKTHSLRSIINETSGTVTVATSSLESGRRSQGDLAYPRSPLVSTPKKMVANPNKFSQSTSHLHRTLNSSRSQTSSTQLLTSPKNFGISPKHGRRPSASLVHRKYAEISTSHSRKSSDVPSNYSQSTSIMPTGTTSPGYHLPDVVKNFIIPNYEPPKCSVRKNGIIKGYAANTNQGLVRNYNEDRVSIILNITKPPNRSNEKWPKCSFFGVYDGHGGANCADFLRDHLHQFVIREPSFPWNPKEAIRSGFAAAEKTFLEMARSNDKGNGTPDRSGSCATTLMIIGDMCYAANVGDSRAILSGEQGGKVYPLSRDHKPSDELENQRILAAGGKIYQTQTPIVQPGVMGKREVVLGPHRVLPGRLSVSRTFGDIEAKYEEYGGNPEVVVATPDIKAFRIAKNHDFAILASDGIYDKVTNRECIRAVWEAVNDGPDSGTHQQCGLGVEYVMKTALSRRTLDNITVVVISFSDFIKKTFTSSAPLTGISDNISDDLLRSDSHTNEHRESFA